MSENFQNLTAIITLPFFICHQNTRLKIEFTWHKIILTWFKINFTWFKNEKKITGSAHNLFTVFLYVGSQHSHHICRLHCPFFTDKTCEAEKEGFEPSRRVNDLHP